MLKKISLFLFSLNFAFVCANESFLTKEEWLKKFEKQEVEEQMSILSGVNFFYIFFDLAQANKEFFKKVYPYMLRNETLPLTAVEKKIFQAWSSSIENNTPTFKNETTEKYLKKFTQLIFKKADTTPENLLLECIKNIDRIESMKKETAEIFNDARTIFLKKMEKW